jgi:hypothetical protein
MRHHPLTFTIVRRFIITITDRQSLITKASLITIMTVRAITSAVVMIVTVGTVLDHIVKLNSF